MSCTVESVTDIEDFSPSVSREPDHGKSQVTANTVRAFKQIRVAMLTDMDDRLPFVASVKTKNRLLTTRTQSHSKLIQHYLGGRRFG